MRTTNTHKRGIRPYLTLQQELEEAAKRKERFRRFVGFLGLALMLGAVAVYLTCSTGCSGIIPGPVAPSDECRYHDDSFIAWQAVTVASSSLGAAVAGGGIVSAALDGTDGAEIGLGVTGAALGALALIGSLLSSHHAARYGEECTGPTVSPETP